MIHGFNSMYDGREESKRRINYYTNSILSYIETLIQINDCQYDDEMTRNMFELFLDIALIFGKGMSE